jgi:hypothetical protein
MQLKKQSDGTETADPPDALQLTSGIHHLPVGKMSALDKTASSTRSESRYAPRNCGTLSATARKKRKTDD